MKILMNNRLNVKTLFRKPNLNVQTCMHLTELMNDSIFKKVVFLIKHISLNIPFKIIWFLYFSNALLPLLIETSPRLLLWFNLLGLDHASVLEKNRQND